MISEGLVGQARKPLLVGVLLLLTPLHAIVGLFAFVLTWLPIFPTRTGLTNLRCRLGLGWLKSRGVLSVVYFNYYLYALEVFVLWPLGLETMEREDELLRFMLALREKYDMPSHRGFIVLGAHFSNIESAGAALCRVFQKGGMGEHVILAKPSALKLITAFFQFYRGRRGIRLLWTDRKDLLRSLLNHARAGDSLCFLVDQKPSSGGIFVKFFNEWAAFPYAGPDVGLRFECPVMHVTARRILPGWFRLEFAEGENSRLRIARPLPPDVQRTGTQYECREVYAQHLSEKELRMAPVLSAFAGWLEVVVRSAPSQWFWDYRKWSRKPKPMVGSST